MASLTGQPGPGGNISLCINVLFLGTQTLNKARELSEDREWFSCGWLWSRNSGFGSVSVIFSLQTQCLASYTLWETDQRMVLCDELDCLRKHSPRVNISREGRSFERQSQEGTGSLCGAVFSHGGKEE